jgi:hypothetical protein
MATTVVLDDDAWAEARDAVTRRFFGIDATEFTVRFTAGFYDGWEPDGLDTVLAYFPELD